MKNAQSFIKSKSYPQYTQVTRVIDGGEPVEFKSLFRHWKDCNLSEVQSNLPKTSVNPNSKFDAEVLHNHPEMVRLIHKGS